MLHGRTPYGSCQAYVRPHPQVALGPVSVRLHRSRHPAAPGPANLRHPRGRLTDVRREISRGEWGERKAEKPKAAVTFGDYAAAWLADRTLKPRTRDHYARLLDNQINPTFETTPLVALTPHTVRAWHTNLGPSTPTLRAHAYALLRTILGEAVHDGEIAANPAHIRGAGNSKRVHKVKPATLGELEALTTAMPDRYQAMVLLAAWCGLRFGELAELRRNDIDIKNGDLHIRRAVVRVNGKTIVEPRSPTLVLEMSPFRHIFYLY